MKKILSSLLSAFSLLAFTACTVSVDESILHETDNEYTNWTFHSSNGYSGGNVKFSGTTVIGEWSITRVINNSAKHPTFDANHGVEFDEIGWYKYEYDFIHYSNWIYNSGYGVSRDGLTLHLDDYYSYKFDSLTGINNEYEYCINAVESITMDVYEFCKLN